MKRREFIASASAIAALSSTTDVLSEGLTVLHHGVLPQPVTADFDQLIRVERDCMRLMGDVAVATGFPDVHEGYLAINKGEIQDANLFEPIQPQPSTLRQLATWNSGYPDGHQNDLVSFEGVVATAVREGSQDEFVLVSNGSFSPPCIGIRPPIGRFLQCCRFR